MVRYGFWCFGFGVCGVGGQVNGAVSTIFGARFGVGIGRREGLGATTGREAISAQDICFLGVATGAESDCFGVGGGVSGSEVFGVVFDEVTGGVSSNVGSLCGGGVAGGVSTAATAFGVDLAYSLGVVIAAVADTVFDAGSAVSLRGGVEGAISLTG